MLRTLAFLFLFSVLTPAMAQKGAKKVLFVIVDGIAPDVLKKVGTPRLDAISKQGGFATAYVGGDRKTYSQTPTISAVGYNSLLTGTWVNKHNVWGNDIKDPNYHYWTIFRFFKEQYPAKKAAVFSTWLDNRTKLLGDGLPQTDHLRMDYFFDGFELDTLHFPHDKESQYIHRIDEKVVDTADEYIRTQAPDLSWVYLEYTDDMGHRYGDAEPYYAAIRMMDEQMGRLWQAIEYRKKTAGEDWLMVVTTDHGRDFQTGRNHGGQSDRERSTWIVTNATGLNAAFTQATPAIVDIMPTIARHLDVTFPKQQAFEVDGVPLTGRLSLSQPKAEKTGKSLSIQWKAHNPEGKVKIWISTTNYFEEGKPDRYLLMGEVPVTEGKATIDISRLPSSYYKIVLEGQYNTVNRWVLE
ncbi:MAG: alkaline phosphatase family protein [Siphonobacter aquaeclarae]|nr:alkaline phosphatase family protein [Siphonobacter aquaeclarae]